MQFQLLNAKKQCLRRTLIIVLLSASGISNVAAVDERSRPEATKPGRTIVSSHHLTDEIVVKFKDDRLADLQVLESLGIHKQQIRPYFEKAKTDLDQARLDLMIKNHKHFAQLSQYFLVHLNPDMLAATTCDVINSLDAIELAYPVSKPVESPTIASTPRFYNATTATPDLTGLQTYYSSSANGGVGYTNSSTVVGITGAGMRVADIEYNWNLNHEDMGLPASTNLDPAPLYDPFPTDQGNHGTAVLGLLMGRANGYGISGFATSAAIYVAPAMTSTFGYNVARAVELAATSLRSGDIILIEQQAAVCNGPDYGPVEWDLAVFDAISIATAMGIVVVEAAGNGGVNLDDVSCEGRFDVTVRNSGALIVGAGDPVTHSRLSFSDYGSRLNVQGWGYGVVTTGYGDLFDPNDLLRRYTQYFNGTSSASAMVAGILTSMQGMARGMGYRPLEPTCLVAVLSQTGTPQPSSEVSTPIGNLPDLEAARSSILGGGISCLEPIGLTVTRSGGPDALLSWTAMPGATGYDVVYGDLAAMRNLSGSFAVATLGQIVCGTGSLLVTQSGSPAPGQGSWFLERDRSGGVPGTYDDGSQRSPRDPGITASGNDCP